MWSYSAGPTLQVRLQSFPAFTDNCIVPSGRVAVVLCAIGFVQAVVVFGDFKSSVVRVACCWLEYVVLWYMAG